MFLIQSAQAQYDNGRLRCHGEMPDEFKMDYKASYQKVLDETQVESGKEAKREKNKFSALVAYEVNEMLHSGKIVYGDSISAFCNQVLDILLRDQKELRAQLKVFTIRSSEVNAFSTHQGILFVTSGLIAKTESEAELAFILSHEIAHYVKRHQLQVFRYSEEVFSADAGHIHSTEKEKTVKTLKYNKKAEYEADEYGLELFLSAGYQPIAAIASMEKLRQASRAPVHNLINYAVLEDAYFKLWRPNFNLDSSLQRIEEEIDEDESTHPNTLNRIQKLREKFNADSLNGSTGFLSEHSFQFIRRQALHDQIYNHLIDGDFVAAMVICDALLDDFSVERENLLISRAMCFYGLQVASNKENNLNHRFYTNDVPHSGTQESFFLFFTGVTKGQMNMLAARETWKAHQEFPKNAVLKSILDLVLKSLIEEEILYRTGDDFKFTDALDEPGNSCNKGFQSPVYSGIFDYLLELVDHVKVKRNSENNHSIRRVILFRPDFFNLDDHQSAKKRLFTQDKYEKLVTRSIVVYGRELDIEMVNPVNTTMMNQSTEIFNEFATLSDYLQTKGSISEKGFFTVLQPEIDAIKAKYRSDYLIISAIWYARGIKKRNSGLLYVFGLINLETGEYTFTDAKIFRSMKKRYLIKAHIYNSLNQINK